MHNCSRRGLTHKSRAYLGWHNLSNATCQVWPYLLCVVRRVNDHHNLRHCSPRLKNTCVRQVVLDK